MDPNTTIEVVKAALKPVKEIGKIVIDPHFAIALLRPIVDIVKSRLKSE